MLIEKRLYAVAPHLLRLMLAEGPPEASDIPARGAQALREAQGRHMAPFGIVIPVEVRAMIAALAERFEADARAVAALPPGGGAPAARHALATELGHHLPEAVEAVMDELRALFVQTMLDRQARAARLAEEAAREIAQVSRQIYFISINASVEAARAGEAGRGFAVIGQQIRALAQQASASLRRLADAGGGDAQHQPAPPPPPEAPRASASVAPRSPLPAAS